MKVELFRLTNWILISLFGLCLQTGATAFAAIGRSTLSPSAFDVPKTQISIFQQTYARPVINGTDSSLRVVSADLVIARRPRPDGTRKPGLGYRFEGQGIVSGFGSQGLNPNLYVEAPEAKLTYEVVKANGLHVEAEGGRAKQDWSRLDSEWALGLWQSRSRWDYLSTRPVGLEGLFVSVKSARWSLLFFGSYLYIPERGPDLLLKNGQFSATQFGPGVPASSGELFSSVTTPIRYKINMPSYSDLLLQPSLGTQVAYGGDRGVFLRAALADKPIRQIQLSFSAVNDVAADLARVDVVPHVDRHTVAAIDAGYRTRAAEVGLSVLGERPRQRQIDPERTHSVLSDALLVGASGSLGLSGIGLKRWSLAAGYLKRWGGDVEMTGKIADSASSSSEARHLYREAVSFGLDMGMDPLSPLLVRSRVIQELTAQATWLSLNIRALTFNSHLGVLLGVDLLASQTSSDDFISKMRTGDRVTGGVSYVF